MELESGWRVVLHDSSRAFGAKHASIYRMVAVSFNISNVTIFYMDINATTTCTHVTCSLTDLIANLWLSINFSSGFIVIPVV